MTTTNDDDFLTKVGSNTLASIRSQIPSNAKNPKIGNLGTGQFPNFQFDLPNGQTLRYSSRNWTLLGSGSFNPDHLTSI